MKTQHYAPWIFAGTVLLSGLILWLLSPMLMPFLLGAFLAYALNPMVCAAARVGVPRSLGAAFTVILLMILVAAAGAMLWPLIESEVLVLIRSFPDMSQKIFRRFQPHLNDWMGYLSPEDAASVNEFLRTSVMSVGRWFVECLGQLFRNGYAIASVLSFLVISPLVTFYLLRDWPKTVMHFNSLVPKRYKKSLESLAHRINLALAGFARGQALVCLVMSLFYCVGLWLCGLDFALIIGLISGILTFVPYLGVFVGMSLAVLTGITQVAEAGSWMSICSVFTAGLAFEGYVVTPRFVGNRIGLHPVWVLFSILAGGQLFGLWGILFAMPAAAVLRILILEALRHYRSAAWFARGS